MNPVHSDLLPPPTLPTKPSQPTPSSEPILRMLREIQSSFHSRLTHLESKVCNSPRTDNRTPNRTQPPPDTTLGSPIPSHPATYAAAAAQPSQRSSPPVQTSKPSSPRLAEPVRFVVPFHGSPPAAPDRTLPKIISDNVNRELASIPTAKGLQVIGSHWNHSGSCILTFPPHTPLSLICDHIPSIRKAMNLSSQQTISHDAPWSKIILSGVFTRMNRDEPTFTDEMLREVLLRNPAISCLNITQNPRWIRPPELIDGFKSSISFAFEDPDGSVLKSVLKTNLFMFGAPVRTKRWVEKPRLRQCTRCWHLGHLITNCRSPVRCRLCSDQHAEDVHRSKCTDCRKENRPDSRACDHPARCINCRGPHAADALDCAERRKYNIPAVPTTHIPPTPGFSMEI